MVAPRQSPVVPPPPASRTNSSQPILKKQSLKQQQQASPLAANGSHEPSPKTKAKKASKAGPSKPNQKSRKSQKNSGGTTLLDKLFLFSLFAFGIYAAVLCRHPASSPEAQPLVCRSLTTYRERILEPYVVPPFKYAYQYAASNPIVQETYKTHIQPHLKTVQHASEPVVNAAKSIDSTVRPAALKAWDAASHRWTTTALPWYRRAVLPRYKLYVEPKLQRGFEDGVRRPLYPYYLIFKEKAAQLHDQLHIYLHQLHGAYLTQLDPTVQQAVASIKQLWVTLEPRLIATYDQLKPILCSVTKQITQGLSTLWRNAKPLIVKGSKEFGNARRQYVDPHVIKILDKVGSSPSPSEAPSHTSIAPAHVTDIPSVVGAEVDPVEAASGSPTSLSAESPTPTEFAEEEDTTVLPIPTTEETIESPISPPSAEPSHEATDEHDEFIVSPTIVESFEPEEYVTVEELKPASVAEESVGSDASYVGEPLADPSGPAQDLEEEIQQDLHEDQAFDQESHVQHGVSAQSTTETTDDLELDDFLQDLGVSGTEVVEETEPAPTELTPEEIARLKEERLAETAMKRADIVGRHKVWQEKLDDLVLDQAERVVKDIQGVREWAVSELGEEYEHYIVTSSSAPGSAPTRASKIESRFKKIAHQDGEEGFGKRTLESVQRQGERLYKGLETYLQKAEKRSAAWKEGDNKIVRNEKRKDELEKWQDLLERVDERFSNIVRGSRGEVHEWYKGVRGREGEAVLEAIYAVKNLAHEAQSDLAMDYAWLDDVTYKDWQRYHDLMRTFERFDDQARAIMNGTSTEYPLPQDPVPLALDKLQQDLDDVILGFQVALGGVRKKSSQVFSLHNLSDDESEDGFFSIKHEKGDLVDDLRDLQDNPELLMQAVKQSRGGKEPVVSILPVNPNPPQDDEQVERIDPATVLIGKDATQVVQALKDIPRETSVRHEEL